MKKIKEINDLIIEILGTFKIDSNVIINIGIINQDKNLSEKK